MLPQRTLIPYVSGAGWSKILPASDLPPKPLLSVCKLSFRAGTNFCQGEQTAARFWTASLEYIRSIPDCTAFYWAPIQNEPETLIALLQWEDVPAWKSFQSSIGFRLMIPILTTECLNRAIPVRLPDGVAAGDIVEMAAFQLPATEPTVDFSAIWDQFAASAGRSNDAQWIVSGGWLERDGPYSIYSEELKALADEQPSVFLALLFCKHGPVTAGTISSSLQEDVSLLSRYVTGHSILTSPLCRETLAQPTPDLAVLSQPISCNSLSSLLSIHPPRIYRQENGFWKSQDKVVGQSLEDHRTGKRLFPGPHGIYSAMGDLSQYSLPCNLPRQPPTVHLVVLFRPMKTGETPTQRFSDLETACRAWTSSQDLSARLLRSDRQWALLICRCSSLDTWIPPGTVVGGEISDTDYR